MIVPDDYCSDVKNRRKGKANGKEVPY